MSELLSTLGISAQAVFSQLMLGIVNGAFYALLSLGLAVIFGLLRLVNFAHGAQYMMGAFGVWMMFSFMGVSYWLALFAVPFIVGIFGIALERLLLRHVHDLDHLYGLMLTYGVALLIVGVFQHFFGVVGEQYPMPGLLKSGVRVGDLYLPYSRIFVFASSMLTCFAVWLLVEKTTLGMRLRAAVEDKALVDAFGINVPFLMAFAYGLAVFLASLAGALAAPIYSISPHMGNDLLITVFAIVVIGGMGSIRGAVITGLSIGVIEGLFKAFYPEGSSIVIFVIMVVVLIFRPSGLFGREE